MNRKLYLFTFFILIISCNSKKELLYKDVIIQIGNEVLTLEDIRNDIPFKDQTNLSRGQVLNYIQRWVENELIVQEAYRLGYHKSILLEKALKKAKKEFLINEVLTTLVSEEFFIPEYELLSYYEQHKDDFIRGKQEIHALHILVDDFNEANAIKRRITRGKEDFEEVAKEVSLDYIRKKRIDMGYFTADEVVPELRRLFTWKVGSVTNPIKSEFGYHIFKILDRKLPNNKLEFDEVKDHIRNILVTKKRKERYQEYITDLKSKVEIETNYDLLDQLELAEVDTYNNEALKIDTSKTLE